MATPTRAATPSGSAGKRPAQDPEAPSGSDTTIQGIYGRLLDLENKENLTPGRMTTHILALMEKWKRQDPRSLWSSFQYEFADWEEAKWQLVQRHEIVDLRTYLMNNGVYIPFENTGRIYTKLITVAKEEDFHDWTTEEIRKHSKRSGDFKMRLGDPAFILQIMESPEWQPPVTPSPYATPPALPLRSTTKPTRRIATFDNWHPGAQFDRPETVPLGRTATAPPDRPESTLCGRPAAAP